MSGGEAAVEVSPAGVGSSRSSRRARALGGASLVLVSVALLACGSLRPTSGSAARHAVGVTSLEVADPARGASFPLEVWYPTSAPAEGGGERYFFAYQPGDATRDAPVLATAERLPLVLLSHGSGGTRFDLAWLAESLASEGFLVACLEHLGNRFGDEDPYVSLQIWLRPQAASLALDHLLADERFGPRIDRARIGAAGHSLGGYTALALAGARYDVHRVREHCAGPRRDPACWLAPDVDRSRIDYSHSHDSFRDPRVRAVMAFAPGVGTGLDPASAAEVQIPVHVVAGRRDQLTPFALHGRAWATALHAELTVIGEGDHYTFLSPCLPGIGLWPWAPNCRDPDGLDRVEVQRRLVPLATSFFRRALGGQAAP